MTAPAQTAPRTIDGRRQRTIDSRARIVSAMIELAREGHVSVSAEQVAERANVGLRTVFRHFNDMDSLYREMSLNVEACLLQQVSLEFKATAWRDRLSELLRRRAIVFEKIAPLKRAEAAHRHRSKVLENDIRRMNAFLRQVLRGVLPAHVVEQTALFESLDLLMSFESWDRLRRDQSLGPRQTRDVLKVAIDRLLAGIE